MKRKRPTLGEWAKRLDPEIDSRSFSSKQKMLKMLSQSNDILKDMLLIEGNLPTGKGTVRTGLPYWREINRGVRRRK